MSIHLLSLMLISGFDWNSLPAGAKVVDVGGGIGSTTLILAQSVPKLQYVVQDRPLVIEDAKAVSLTAFLPLIFLTSPQESLH